ncbi:MAG: hypothetical protein AAFS03_03865, partial [Pseudomonadota bacterium]
STPAAFAVMVQRAAFAQWHADHVTLGFFGGLADRFRDFTGLALAEARTATEEAKRNMVRVPLREGRTLHHDGKGRWGAGKVVLRAAPPGTGVIAGGPMRAVMEVLGIQDVVGKSIGSSNPYNMVRATFDALKEQASPRMVASKRSLKVQDVVNRRNDGVSEAGMAAETTS